MTHDEELTAVANQLLVVAERMQGVARNAVKSRFVSRETILAMRLVEIAAEFKVIAEEWLEGVPDNGVRQ